MTCEQITTGTIIGLLTSPATKRELKEIVKLGSDSLKNRTYESLLSEDEEYDDRRQEFLNARQKYLSLQLTDEQREVIETLMARENECDYDLVSNAYLAGLLDGYRILKYFGLTKE